MTKKTQTIQNSHMLLAEVCRGDVLGTGISNTAHISTLADTFNHASQINRQYNNWEVI